MKTIHIINSNHSLSLKKHLLKDSSTLANTEVLPFNIAFKMDQDSHELLVQAYQVIKNLKLQVLTESALNPTNIESYLTFTKEMHLYNLDETSLPTSTTLQQDNHLIITALLPLVKKPIVDKNTRYIAYNHYLDHSQLAFLTQHNIEITNLSDTTPNIRYHKTLNIRHEIEAALQNIIKNKEEDVCFVIPSLKERIPLIETIFNRYGLNLNLQDHSSLINRKKFIALYNLVNHNSQENLIKALENHALGGIFNLDIIYLIQVMDLSLPLPQKLSSINKDIQKIIDRCSTDYDLLINQISHLKFNDTFVNNVTQTYNLLNQYSSNLGTLRSFIENNVHLYDQSTAHLFLFQLEKLTSKFIENDVFKFYDLNDFSLINETNVYALDMSSKNYPALGPNTGVLDDAYREQVQGYPSLQLRTAHSLNNKAKFMAKSKNLWLSYAYTNYEGKGQEPSFELFGNESSIPIAPVEQILEQQRPDLTLKSNHVQSLLMENGRINASITSLEQYQKDPLMFLIERGFKFRQPEYPTFGPMELGNINHNDIECHLSSKAFDDQVWNLFPSSPRMKMIQYRNNQIMTFSKLLVDQSIDISVLKPKFLEYSFSEAKLFDNFVIKGKIDRIDENEDNFIIYDYKSSDTRLINKAIQNGEQLQLLTYALIYNDLCKKDKEAANKLLGVFYFSLRPKNYSFSNYKYTRGKGLEKLEMNVLEDVIKERSYKGFIFNDITGLFEEEGYHQSVVKSGAKKDFGTIKLRGTPYNILTTQRVLEDVYRRIYLSISGGNFDVYQVRKNLRPVQYFNLTKDYQEQVKGDQ